MGGIALGLKLEIIDLASSLAATSPRELAGGFQLGESGPMQISYVNKKKIILKKMEISYENKKKIIQKNANFICKNKENN